MEKIMKTSKAGKSIILKINETNEKNLKKFKKIEEDLKKDEEDLIAKRNILSEEDYEDLQERIKFFNFIDKAGKELEFLPDYIQTFTTLRAQTGSEYQKVSK